MAAVAPTAPATTAAWRVLPLEQGEPGDLLAEGIRLLDGLSSEPRRTLRWYRSTMPAVVLGRGQSGLVPTQTAVLGRWSGGGAVLMDDDLLSLDVLLPAGDPLLTGDLAAVFDSVGGVWAEALRDLGVPDLAVHPTAGTARRRGDARERLLAAVCYATLGRGEVTSGGRKLVGLAQRRRRSGALVQCGLLRRWRPGPLLSALGAREDDPEIQAAAVGLDDLLTDPPSDAEVMAAVARHAARLDGSGRD